MTFKKYISLTRAGILDSLQFRLALVMTVLGNLLYLLLIYNLWNSIYASVDSAKINGMTFADTMIYLVFASALFNFMEMWLVWHMGRDFQTGQIIVDLLKPMKFRTYTFFRGCGELVVKFVTTFLPTAIVVFFVSKGRIQLESNVLFFVVSVFFSLLINFYINFMVATICMYTQSIWGINVMKDVIVSLLSGATVPIAFFPDALRKVVMLLPFQAICNTPLNLLIQTELSFQERFSQLALQLFWVILLSFASGAFFKHAVKRITVNGG